MSLARNDTHLPVRQDMQTPPVRVSTQALDLFSIAKAFAQSGFFQDARQEAQAVVKIMAGQELGIPPFQSMTGIHVMNGKLSLSANLIANIVKSSGKYDYRVRRWDNEACELEFYQRGELLGPSSFTLQDARQAGLLAGGNKGNWERYPRNMLFARSLTNGARIYCPDVFGGPIYTPEEMGAEVDGESGEVLRLPASAAPTREVNTATGEVIDVTNRVTAASEQAPSYAGAMVDQSAQPAGADAEMKSLADQILGCCKELGIHHQDAKTRNGLVREYCSAAFQAEGGSAIASIGKLNVEERQKLVGLLAPAVTAKKAAFAQLTDLDIPTDADGRATRLEYWGNILGRELSSSTQILPREWETIRNTQLDTIRELKAAQNGAPASEDPFQDA